MTVPANPQSSQELDIAKIFTGLRPVHRPRGWEKVIEAVLFLCAITSIVITAGIIFTLLFETASFFGKVSIFEFLFTSNWKPTFDPPAFGILPLVSGTLMTTGVALLVAVPAGTIIAIYLSEFASPWVREVLKPLLELLSAVPTVVYGYFALLFVTPLLQKFVPGLGGFSILSAGLVMGVMIIPYVSSLSEDAMRAVPMILREGSYALGANRIITAWRVVVPAALSGIASAYILGISRAIGETMVVAIAAGNQPILTLDPRAQAQTITAFIVQLALGDLPHASVGYRAIFAAGTALFVMTLVFNGIGFWLRKKYHESY